MNTIFIILLAIILVLIVFIALMSGKFKILHTTGNKRIREVKYRNGKCEYICEEEFENGIWKTIERGTVEDHGMTFMSYATFDTKEDALNYLYGGEIISDKIIEK